MFGVSRDNMESHDKFKANLELPFELIADTEEKMCHMFGVVKNKIMYGKKVKGIERSTFLIDADGVLQAEWRGLKVAGHVDEVLKAVKALKKTRLSGCGRRLASARAMRRRRASAAVSQRRRFAAPCAAVSPSTTELTAMPLPKPPPSAPPS